jgi:hypothetical protein
MEGGVVQLQKSLLQPLMETCVQLHVQAALSQGRKDTLCNAQKMEWSFTLVISE